MFSELRDRDPSLDNNENKMHRNITRSRLILSAIVHGSVAPRERKKRQQGRQELIGQTAT